MAEDYHRILGVARDASRAEIQKAYRELARRHHPDANPDDPGAAKRFARIEDAYEMLCEPERRKSKGAYHTVASAFMTVHSLYRPDPPREAMADNEFLPALVGMATVIWLVVVCTCVLISLPSGPSGDLPSPPVTEASVSVPSPQLPVDVILGLATAVYAAVVFVLIAKWRQT